MSTETYDAGVLNDPDRDGTPPSLNDEGPVFDEAEDDAEELEPQTLLDELKDETSREIKPGETVLATQTRPGWSVVYDTDISQVEIDRWRKQAKDRKAPDGVDGVMFGSLLLAHKCIDIIRDDAGRVGITFRTKQFLEWMKAGRAVEAVRGWYKSDGHLQIDANAVLLDAGYDPDGAVRSQDPTQGS